MAAAPRKTASPLKKVDSTAFSHVGYDPVAHTLTVVWRSSGQRWRYDGVNLERGTAFMGSASMGRYFADQIRDHHEGREVYD
jgi:hypothetical protein